MNIVDLIICAILGLSIISGMHKGFITSTLATVGFFGSWLGANALYGQLAAAIQGNASLMNMLRYYIDTSSLFQTVGLASANAAESITSGQLSQALAELNIPKVILQTFQSNVQSGAFASMNLTTLADYLNQTLLSAAINILSFVVMFAISYIVILLFVNLLGNVFRFPVLKHFDWLAGGAFGAVRGYFIVAMIFSILPTILSAIPLELVQNMLDQSAIASLFSGANFLTNLIHTGV